MAGFLDRPKVATLGKQTAGILRNLQRYLPGYSRMLQDLEEELAPRQQALGAKLFQQFAPEYSRIGSEIAGQQQLAELANNIAAMRGPGREAVTEAESLDRLINPEFYAQREAVNAGYLDLLGGMDPNELSGAELANLERGINRMNVATGNLNVGDATSTAANAALFGEGLSNKRAQFAQALNLFPGISAAGKSPINAFNVGTGKTAGPNIGTAQYTSNLGELAKQGSEAQSGLFGAEAQRQQLRTQEESGVDLANKVWGGIAGPVCGCYIFKEHYGYPDVPDYIRWCRDFFYKKDRRIAKGYKRMSTWIVPLMQKWKIVRLVMTYGCIFPLAAYGQYLTGYKRWTKVFKPFKLWLTFWRIYGSRS